MRGIMGNITAKQILDVISAANIMKDVNILIPDKPLSEQGIDSLDFSGVLFNLEEILGIEIPDEDIDDLLTIDDIAAYINMKK
jgi:acyl carrier protein